MKILDMKKYTIEEMEKEYKEYIVSRYDKPCLGVTRCIPKGVSVFADIVRQLLDERKELKKLVQAMKLKHDPEYNDARKVGHQMNVIGTDAYNEALDQVLGLLDKQE